jgi:hypothetical protein
MKREKARAYHEAGHAVVARVLGVTVTHVAMFSTKPDNSAVAQTHSAYWSARFADAATQATAFEKDAKVSMAGFVAQLEFRPFLNAKKALKHARSPESPWSGDIRRAKSQVAAAMLARRAADKGVRDWAPTNADHVSGAEALPVWNQLQAETEALVAENWPAIERVAEALLTRPLLSQDEVDALVWSDRTTEGR